MPTAPTIRCPRCSWLVRTRAPRRSRGIIAAALSMAIGASVTSSLPPAGPVASGFVRSADVRTRGAGADRLLGGPGARVHRGDRPGPSTDRAVRDRPVLLEQLAHIVGADRRSLATRQSRDHLEQHT